MTGACAMTVAETADKVKQTELKSIAQGTSVPLTGSIIINKSLYDGVISIELAKVLPIYKNKSKEEFINYRPIKY